MTQQSLTGFREETLFTWHGSDMGRKRANMMQNHALEAVMSYWYIRDRLKGEETGIRTLTHWLFDKASTSM